jgi:tetratricopeptide (TPR) repeat protein
MQMELPADLYSRITQLSSEGDALAEKSEFESAIAKYNEAWEVIPEPKNNWEASTWLLAAIGDACFLSKYYKSGIEAFQYALSWPNGNNNPFINLRLGQCLFEKEDLTSSAEYLCSAYMLVGKDIFKSENTKYFEFLKTKIQKPASGVW